MYLVKAVSYLVSFHRYSQTLIENITNFSRPNTI